jgi:hypothetical protein
MRPITVLAGLTLVGCGRTTRVEGTKVDATVVDEDADGFTEADGDCDDSDADVHPGADEVCNDRDDDCDGRVDIDAGDITTWFPDGDDDGFGVAEGAVEACDQPVGFVAETGDCDDADADIHPAAQEVCDAAEVDEDCDGRADDADDSTDTGSMTVFYADIDGDGFGDDAVEVRACRLPAAASAVGGDCDDAEALARPDGTEVCGDGIDNDCDGDARQCALAGDVVHTDAESRILGDAPSDYFGELALLDFDGDGVLDVVSSGTSTGTVVVSGPLPAGTTGTASALGQAVAPWGAVAAVGDVDGDGIGDLVVGNGFDTERIGAAWLVYGGTTSPAATIASGSGAYGYFANGPAPIGDVNGDGYADLAFGALGDDTHVERGGAVFLLFGGAARLSGEVGGAGGFDLVIRAGDDGVAHQLGYTRATAGGDLNGDGVDDLVLGAPGPTSGGTGIVGLFEGPVSAGSGLLGDADARLLGGDASQNSFFAAELEVVDITGDGLDDLLIGEPNGGTDNAGVVYAVAGASAGWAPSRAASAAAQFTVSGTVYGDALGRTASAADVDQDGALDLLIGSTGTQDGVISAGRAHLLYGPLSAGDHIAADEASFILTGGHVQAVCGISVALADVDADGWDDALVGCTGAGASGPDFTGTVGVLYGSGI